MACPRHPMKFGPGMGAMKWSPAERKFPPLRLRLSDCDCDVLVDPGKIREVVYRTELDRGYDYEGDLWSPGIFRIDLQENETATFVASIEEWSILDVLTPRAVDAAERSRRERLLEQAQPFAQDSVGAELVLAADQFVIMPAGRTEEEARAHAAGDEVRTVIAGYHWFTDWGRDTMISLEGLTITTGRTLEAGYILRTFASLRPQWPDPEYVSG